MQGKVERCQGSEYRRLHEIVRQEYEFKIHQLESNNSKTQQMLEIKFEREKALFES